MNKVLLSVFIILLAGFGCSKKSGTSTDTTNIPIPPKTSVQHMDTVAHPSSQIMPPGVANPGGPITITLGNNAVQVSGTFNGTANQSVTVPGFGTFNSPNPWNVTIPAGTAPVTITAKIMGTPYPRSVSSPGPYPITTGYDQTTYSDGTGTNNSQITIQEQI